ncbi:C10 family peptidase [Parabacteroides sp.]
MKRFYLIMAALGLAVGAWAERVDQSTALRVAGQVAKSRTALRSAGVPELRLVYQAPVATGLRSSSASEADYYVFNVGDEQGFVIVSGEDRTHPVLGYAHEGSFQADRIPVNLSAWLEGYQREIAQLVKSDISAPASVRAEWDRYLGGTATNTSSGKVIQTVPWGQDAPFNWMTPKVESGKSTLTCCVATALAIVMRHHGKKNPALTAGKKEFKLAVGEMIAEAEEIAEKYPDRLKPFTVNYSGAYNWEAMQDSYAANTYTRESGEAVAKLMWELGASINVRYASDVSTTNVFRTIEPLRSIFGYTYASYQQKEWYTWEEWKTIVKNEIDADRPFLLAGANSQASIGHAFVCDGYDGNSEDGLGLVHINWGWNGYANGFFQLSTLEAPDSGSGYDTGQEAVIGLDPGLTALPEVLSQDPVGYFNVEEPSQEPGVLEANNKYEWPVVLFNRALEPQGRFFGLCVVDMEDELKIVAEPTFTVSPSISVLYEGSLSITLKNILKESECVMICYRTKESQWEPVDTPLGMPFGIDADGDWIAAPMDEANDPEISFQANFDNNQFTDKYSALNQLALPVSYRITQPDQVATIRYVVDEESKKLLEGGWVLKGETLSQDGNPLPDSKEITITGGATTLDLPFNSKYFNTTNKVYKQMLTLTFPEEKMESETVKPTGTFKYTVELLDKDCNKLNNEELGGELVLLEKPMAWNLTLENVVEDEAEDRAKSFDAVFTPLSVDDKLKEGNTDLYVSFKSYPGVTVKVTDAGGKDIPVNADFRTDAISEKLTENTTLKLHIELDGNVPGQELFPVIKTAYHNNKQISSKTYALDVYNELEDRYFVVQPKLEDPEYDPDLNGFEEAAFTLTSFTSLDKAGDLIFIFTPEDPEAWDDQVCYFDGKEIKDLIWDCEETMGKKLSFSFSGDGSGQVYQIEEDEDPESSMIDYVIPFRVKSYTEGLLTYSVEIWNPDQDVCVKKIDNQTLRFVKPLEVTSEESKGEINTDVPLKLTVKAEAKTLLMGTKVRPRFTLPAGDLPEGKIALKVDGTEYPFEEVQPEVLCVTLPEITLDAENKLNYTICSSVPLNQTLKFALLDAEDREVPMGDKQSDVDVQIYTYYQLIFDLQNVTRDEIKESDDVKIGKDGNLKIRTSIADLSIALQKEGDYELPLAIELLAGDTPVKEGYSYSNGIITINTIKSDYRLVATGVKTEECVVVYDVESVIHPTLRKVEQTKEAKLFLEAAGGHLLPKAIRIFVKKVSEVQEEAQPAGFLRSEEGETEGAETDVPEGYEELREGTDFTYNATTGQITLTVPDKAKVLMIQAKAEKDPTPPSPTYYSISLPSVEGAMVVADGSTYVEEGSSFSFTIRLDPEYDQSKPVVKANGAVIEPDAEGVYHLSAVYGDVTIEIEGVVKNMPTGTDDAETGQPTAWATEGVLHVYMPAKADLRVYAFQGGLIYAEDAVIGERTIAPGQGVYIVVIGEKRFKLKV